MGSAGWWERGGRGGAYLCRRGGARAWRALSAGWTTCASRTDPPPAPAPSLQQKDAVNQTWPSHDAKKNPDSLTQQRPVRGVTYGGGARPWNEDTRLLTFSLRDQQRRHRSGPGSSCCRLSGDLEDAQTFGNDKSLVETNIFRKALITSPDLQKMSAI